MFRRNPMMFTLAILTATACVPDFVEPHETDGADTNNHDDDENVVTTAGASDGDENGATTGSDASTSEDAGTTGDASSTGDGGDDETPIHDTDSDEPPVDPPGDGLACEGDPCVSHEDCSGGLDDLMCLPIVNGASVCVEFCDVNDLQTCDGQPERCTNVNVAMVCLPPIPKTVDDSGACVPLDPDGEEPPMDPPADEVPCEGQPCETNEDCSNDLEDLECLPSTALPRVCVERCDPEDALACDGMPERCTPMNGSMVCLPPLVKGANDAGECVSVS